MDQTMHHGTLYLRVSTASRRLWRRVARTALQHVAVSRRDNVFSLAGVAVLFFHFSRLLLLGRSYKTIILRFRTFDIFKWFDLTK